MFRIFMSLGMHGKMVSHSPTKPNITTIFVGNALKTTSSDSSFPYGVLFLFYML